LFQKHYTAFFRDSQQKADAEASVQRVKDPQKPSKQGFSPSAQKGFLMSRELAITDIMQVFFAVRYSQTATLHLPSKQPCFSNAVWRVFRVISSATDLFRQRDMYNLLKTNRFLTSVLMAQENRFHYKNFPSLLQHTAFAGQYKKAQPLIRGCALWYFYFSNIKPIVLMAKLANMWVSQEQ